MENDFLVSDTTEGIKLYFFDDNFISLDGDYIESYDYSILATGKIKLNINLSLGISISQFNHIIKNINNKITIIYIKNNCIVYDSVNNHEPKDKIFVEQFNGLFDVIEFNVNNSMGDNPVYVLTIQGEINESGKDIRRFL